MSRMAEFTKDLEILDRARYPLVYLVTSEERRAEVALRALAQGRKKSFFSWTITQGLRGEQDRGSVTDPIEALTAIIEDRGEALYLLKDFDAFLDNPVVARRVRDAADVLRASRKTIFITSARMALPPSLEKDVHVLDFPLPDLEELDLILGKVLETTAERVRIELNNGEREAVLKAALGLTWDEAENVFAKSLVAKKALDPALITDEKQQIIRKSEVLEYFPAVEQMSDVGGLDALKEWIGQAGLSFTEKARSYGVEPVKGTLLLGVPGGGKSLIAKAIANVWKWPLIRADLGRLYGGIVGDTERNVRRMTQLAEGVAPCVLWLDEVEKGIGGLEGSAQSTGGVELRLFGHLLTWMQEYRAPVFIVATANDVRSLRPEFIRRFRHVWFVDLPDEQERKAIFEIHLRKRRRDPKDYDLGTLVNDTAGFSGAEIEKVVQEALLAAFAKGSAGKVAGRATDIEQSAMEWARPQITPISRTMKEQIQDLRDWVGAGRARSASLRKEIAQKDRAIDVE